MQYTKGDEGYYDFEVSLDDLLGETSAVEEMFKFRDLKSRRLYLSSEITQESADEIIKHILRYNREDKDVPIEERTPIMLYITSDGGDVDTGFELIDIIIGSKTPVYTVCLGYWYSMALLIGLAGHKRFATKHSKFLMHDGFCAIQNSGQKVYDRMEFQKKIEDKVKNYVLEVSNITEKEYDEKIRIEWYLFSDEAKEKGFVDYIVGEDVDLDSVI